MLYLFIIAISVITILVVFMFIILKKTVKKINSQTKLYFVDKLQEYDYLIQDKQEKLNQINNELKEKETQKKEENIIVNKNNYEFDYNIIDLLNKTKYQDDDILKLAKEIDTKFNLDYNSILNKFISCVTDNNNIYNFCLKLKQKFSSKVIYDIKLLDDYRDYLKKMLDKNEYKIYEVFETTNNDTSIENFITYINELIDLNNPNILVYVGKKDENYDHLSKYIHTKYTSSIYRGIKVIYKNKLYDFSLSERNA